MIKSIPDNRSLYRTLKKRKAMIHKTITIEIAILLCILGASGNTLVWDEAKVKARASNILVFPGAEGFGVYTQAGRGGTVYRVTHLSDENTGLGSLRAACEASGPRTVIFEVSGTIEMDADINITNPYITIAGQTAPYPGIQLKGAGIRIAATHDVLIQHLRIRPGDNSEGPDPTMRRAISISHSGSNIPYNIVIDHCSLQWGIDANANIYAKDAHDITYSNCIISEGLDNSLHPDGPHAMGLNIIYNFGGGHRNISVIKNLISHSRDRNPQIGGNTDVQLVNNVMYNCRTYHIRITDSKSLGPHNTTIVGNHSIIGDDSLHGKDYVATIFDSVADGTRIYENDNMSNNYPGPTIQDLKGPGITWLSSPEVWADVVVIPTSNNQARNWVLNNAGAWPGARDSVDIRVTDEVRNGTGHIIDSQDDVGGWPQYAENHNTLYLPNNFDDDDGDGYTNLEEWMHVFSDCVEQGGTILISGTVTVGGLGLAGVVMNGLPGNPMTDGSGNYIAKVNIGWSGTVTPSKSGYSLFPNSKSYFNLDTAVTGEEYTASSSSHTVTTPNTPSGSSSGVPNVSYTFSTGGSTCSQGHSMEYRLDWGDGTFSQWSSSTSASHSWSSTGTYTIRARSRCSSNTSIVSAWSSGTTIQISNSSGVTLSLSSATGDPAPGQGGTTNPSSGDHSYTAGSTPQVTALPNSDYRFSVWTGDVSNPDAFIEEITLTMNQNKSITANFCTKCGDANGDLLISPADAQAAFDIYLGKIQNPTACMKENSDVNSSGTKTVPEVTPADAQAIFNNYLSQAALPNDCSGTSRASSFLSASMIKKEYILEKNIFINPIQVTQDEFIEVPILLDNPFNLDAFGFDLLYPSEIIEFIILERTELTEDFNRLEVNKIGEGALRIGGYRSEPVMNQSPSVLITLVFRVIGEVQDPTPISIINTVDDFKNAFVRIGKLSQN